MQKSILGYNSFTQSRISRLNENDEEKNAEMEELRILLVKNPQYFSPKMKMEDAVWNDKDKAIDFEGDVSLLPGRYKEDSLSYIPFKFGHVYGDFSCSGSDNLKNLISGPKSCYDFDAQDCSLESLEGAPEMTHNFDVRDNLIVRLNGGPKYVFGDFNLSGNLIRSIDNGPLLITGTITFMDCARYLTNPEKGRGGKSLIRLFSEMHQHLTREYMSVGQSYEIKTKEKIEADIASGDYAYKLLVQNPDYEVLLGNFMKNIKDADHLRPLKDLGIF
jgi:hypothetical protein